MKTPLFLDWDGVLIDSLGLYLALFQNLCRDHNKVLPVSDAQGFREWYEPKWEKNFAELGFTDKEYQDICANYPKTLDYSQASLFEGVEELIDECSQKSPLVVVSTAPTANIEERLEEAGLRGKFAAVTGSDDGGTDKTARLLKLRKEYGDGVMVGDTDLDVKSGREAGLVTIGVTYGWLSESRVKESGPDYLVSKPSFLRSTIHQALHHSA